MPGLPSKVSGLWPFRTTGAATAGWRPTASNTDCGRSVTSRTIAVGAACQESALAVPAAPAGPTPHPITDPPITRLAAQATSLVGVRRNLTAAPPFPRDRRVRVGAPTYALAG